MIDLLDIQIDIPHTPFGANRVIRQEDSNVGIGKRLTKKVGLYFNASSLLVTSLDNGRRIAIRCSPLKAMQGHNIFGTDRLRELGYHLICYVLETMEIPAGATKFKRWERGHYAIHELHITYRLRVGSHLFVLRVLRHLLRKLNVKLRPAWMKKGIGIEFNSPNPGATWSMYDKLQEFDDKRNHEDQYLRALVGEGADIDAIEALLRQEATGNIRAELKFDRPYMVKHDLAAGADWGDKEKVKKVFLAELDALGLDRVPSIAHGQRLLDGLTDPKLRTTFFLWLHGEDLSTYHERQTLTARRKAIKAAIGIDIQLDQVPTTKSAVDIEGIFCGDNILPDKPEWIDDYPALYYKGLGLPGLDAP